MIEKFKGENLTEKCTLCGGEKYPILVKAGYLESRKKHGLFYKPDSNGVFFVDFRHTKAYSNSVFSLGEVLFYLRVTNGPKHNYWILMKTEADRLRKLGWRYCQVCGPGGSFPFEMLSSRDYKPEIDPWDCDCETCVKLKEEERIKESERIKRLHTCKVCGKTEKYFNDLVEHHISYDPEITVYVHRGCHTKIHASKEYPLLKPSEEQMKIKKELEEEKKKAIEEKRKTEEEAYIKKKKWVREIIENKEPIREKELVRLARWKAKRREVLRDEVEPDT